MPSYRKRDLTGLVVPVNPSLEPLTGGKIGFADRVASVFLEQDKVLGSGRRVVAMTGLNGADEFAVGSTDPDDGGGQDYPDAVTARVACRAKFDLTPGAMLRCVAIVAPSGATQRLTPGGGGIYESAGGGGQIVVDTTFTNSGGSENVVTVLDTPVSSNEFYGESTTAGAVWAEAHRLRSKLIQPDMLDAATAASWSDGVTVELSIAYRGGVRPISVVVFEEPLQYVRSLESEDWASSVYTDGGGKPLGKYPSPWPVDATNLGGNPANGTTYLMATAERQRTSLGPMLLTASAWNEASQAVTSAETDEKTTTSTTPVDLWRTSTTGWAATRAGWSMSSGGNAPGWNTGGPHLELRDVAMVVPMRVRVYAKKTGGGTGTLRVMTQVYSLCELSVTSTSWGWVETTATLKCGMGPEDPSNLLILGFVSAGGTTLHVRNVTVEYVDR